MNLDKGVIIMAAPNGARLGQGDHPNLPISAKEIAHEALRCSKAGAAMIHVHVRDDEGAHSLDAGRYQELVTAIRTEVGDALIPQITTEAVGKYKPDGMMSPVLNLFPDAVSIALREIMPDRDWEAHALEAFEWMHENAVWPQFILYDADDVRRFRALQDAGSIPFKVPYLLFVLGRYTVGQVSDPSDLDPFLEALGDGPPIRWGMCAFGAAEHNCVRRAIALGGDVRVGFENNRLLPGGGVAEYTADLVALASRAAAEAGRHRLTAAEVRSLIPEWIGGE